MENVYYDLIFQNQYIIPVVLVIVCVVLVFMLGFTNASEPSVDLVSTLVEKTPKRGNKKKSEKQRDQQKEKSTKIETESAKSVANVKTAALSTNHDEKLTNATEKGTASRKKVVKEEVEVSAPTDEEDPADGWTTFLSRKDKKKVRKNEIEEMSVRTATPTPPPEKKKKKGSSKAVEDSPRVGKAESKDSPRAASKVVDSPRSTSKAVDSPRPTNKAVDSPRPTNKAVDSPRPTNKAVDSPRPTNKAVDSPRPTNKAVDSPWAASKAVDSPRSTSKAVDNPKAASKGGDDNPKVSSKAAEANTTSSGKSTAKTSNKEGGKTLPEKSTKLEPKEKKPATAKVADGETVMPPEKSQKNVKKVEGPQQPVVQVSKSVEEIKEAPTAVNNSAPVVPPQTTSDSPYKRRNKKKRPENTQSTTDIISIENQIADAMRESPTSSQGSLSNDLEPQTKVKDVTKVEKSVNDESQGAVKDTGNEQSKESKPEDANNEAAGVAFDEIGMGEWVEAKATKKKKKSRKE